MELGKVSRSGLIDALTQILTRFGFDRDQALRVAKTARKEGRYIDAMAAHDRFKRDPRKAIDQYIRRKASAKKAAAKRKREAKKRSKANG